VIAQVADALQASHAVGVIHRDLKPSNIMLVPGEAGDHAIVTDFGLARSFAPSAPNGDPTTQVFGTFDYMAPELLAGRQATVASDVYALGVVACQVLTGSFPRGAEEPESLRAVPGLSAPVARIIARAVDPVATRRPTLSAIASAIRESGSFRGGLLSFGWWRRPATRRAMGFLLLTLALAAGIIRYMRQDAGIQPGSLVYLMKLNNATQEAELDVAGDLLRNHLQQSPHIRLLDEARIARARELIGDAAKTRSSADVAREVALRAGAALVVFTTLTRLADNYELSVEMQRTGAAPAVVKDHWQHKWTARGRQEIFTAIRDSGEWIRSVAGESADNRAELAVPPEEATSSSWEALAAYKNSESLKASGQTDGAIALLRRALELDPDFALAHVRLADILQGVRRQEEAFDHYRRALAAASKRRLTLWEELRLRGTYALDVGEYGAAEGAFRELRSRFPQDSQAPHYLAAAVKMQGRLEDAALFEHEAIGKAPDATAPVVALMGDNVLLGKLEDARSQALKLAELGAPTMSTEYQGIVRFLMGDWAGARADFETELKDSSALRRSHAFSLLAAWMAERGEFHSAMQEYRDGIAADLAAGLSAQAAQKYLALASLHFTAGEFSEARTHALEAVRVIRHLDYYRRAGAILARAGFTADAQRLLDDLTPAWPGPLADAARHQIRGEILLQQGRRAEALRELVAADRIDSPLRHREYLAHAYASTGDPERALFLYQSMIRSWGPFWQYADCDLPAIRTSALLQVAALERVLGHAGRSETALREYQQIRPQADDTLPETQMARKLLAPKV
jgi:serine/threonine protein kinase